MFLSSTNTICSAGNEDPEWKAAVLRGNYAAQYAQGTERRIRDMFTTVELSPSSYDTAWMAMVPSPTSLREPCFPQCLNWLLENQRPDGSWGLPGRRPLLAKDSLLATLASILALRRWEDGTEHVRRGIQFIGSNFGAILETKQLSPIGFDIIFPGMVKYAKDLGLILPLDQNALDIMLCKRDYEFERLSRSNSKGKKAYLAYIAEGLIEMQDWKDMMKYQRKNGSLFNSPSTTAATQIHFHDGKCFEYLSSLLERFGNAVPTTYPMDIYARLRMVDNLERLGIERHFKEEIKNVLDETHRCWLLTDENIVLDIETSALAFRLLRTNGYGVSSDALAEFSEEEYFFDSVEGDIKAVITILELYRASQVMILPSELVLEKLQSWTSIFLNRQLSSDSIHDDKLHKEVYYALKFPYHLNVERLGHRRNVECYDVDSDRVLKTVYKCSNISNQDFLQLAVEDYNFCQSLHQKELKYLAGWMEENRLDKLKFARQKLTYLYFSIGCILFAPELSDARISWTKNSVLATIIDDFFDVGGCSEELLNLIKLVEDWDGNSIIECCSEQVDIIFSTLRTTVHELGAIAFTRQGRSVKRNLVDLWLSLLKSMMKESEWGRNKSIPTMDEYISNGCVSFALGPVVLITLYFLRPELSEGIMRSQEFSNLVKHMNICGRLSNDIQSFKREGEEGKLNSVLLHMIHGSGTVSEEEAVKEMKGVINNSQRELLKLVLQTKGSVVPKLCKDLFWKTCQVIHYFYHRNDGFTSPDEMVNSVNAVIHDPLNYPSPCLGKRSRRP